uniref:Uncharacterized protein n=1 Tax=Timema bartmani TaxID=61472 RepID=A0A7R9F2C4_9NEOP|nr:unnamed protein product [Timema bartmani]
MENYYTKFAIQTHRSLVEPARPLSPTTRPHDDELPTPSNEFTFSLQFGNEGIDTLTHDTGQATDGRIVAAFLSSFAEFDTTQPHNILFGVIGDKTFDRLTELVAPEVPNSKSFGDLVSVLNGHFALKHNEIVQTFNFSKRDQRFGESIVEYVAVLREMANRCNFETFTNRMLRDRLVQAVADETVQREMLSKNEMKLDEATYMAVSVMRLTSAKPIGYQDQEADPMEVHRLPRNDQSQKRGANNQQSWGTKQPLCILGWCNVEATYNGLSATLPVTMVEGNGSSLLGKNWFTELGIKVQGIHHITDNRQTTGFAALPQDMENMRVFTEGAAVWARQYGVKKPKLILAVVTDVLGRNMYRASFKEGLGQTRYIDQLRKRYERTPQPEDASERPLSQVKPARYPDKHLVTHQRARPLQQPLPPPAREDHEHQPVENPQPQEQQPATLVDNTGHQKGVSLANLLVPGLAPIIDISSWYQGVSIWLILAKAMYIMAAKRADNVPRNIMPCYHAPRPDVIRSLLRRTTPPSEEMLPRRR